MKKLIIIIFVFSVLPCFAANIYVDKPPAESGSGWNEVNGTSYTGSPGAGTGYATVQQGIDAMVVGDTLYMRGDTYQEGHISIDPDTHAAGTAWTTGNYYTITSYPGEWAILDGENGGGSGGTNGKVIATDNGEAAALAGEACAMGYSVPSTIGANARPLVYWKFERFEVKNARSAGGDFSSAIYIPKGPVWFRYLYIHDNYATSDEGFYMATGISGWIWRDSIVEYCSFENNGALNSSNANVAHIVVYGYDDNPVSLESANIAYNNEFRYNYYGGGSPQGIYFKHQHYLATDNTGTDTTFEDYGPKIHHNIFEGQVAMPLALPGSDFAQIYNNIFDQAGQTEIDGAFMGVTSSIYSRQTREPFSWTVYNNTFKGTMLSIFHNNTSSYETYTVGAARDYNPSFYAYNNIIDTPEVYDGLIGVAIWSPYGTDLSAYYDDTKIYFENNLFAPFGRTTDVFNYAPSNNLNITELVSSNMSDITYNNTSTTGLYSSGYLTNPSYSVQTSPAKTISDGGNGVSHPYLSGVTIPAYVGATNPDDNDWVVGVSDDLTTVSWLQGTADRDENDNPTWVEGSVAPGDESTTIGPGTSSTFTAGDSTVIN